MKSVNYLFVVAAIISFLPTCKKSSNNPQANIVGKWRETKLTIQQQTKSTGATKSITFSGADFTAGDYFQFNKDHTAVISTDGTDFNINGSIRRPTANVNAGGQSYYRSYTVKGSLLILQIGLIPTCNGCPQPGPDTAQIVKLDAGNLVLRNAIDTSSTYRVTTDTYYTKQ